MLMLKTPVRYLDFYGLKTDPTKARVVISTEHAEDVFDLIKAEKSVRLVAEAGTGKTTILREVKKKLVEEFSGYFSGEETALVALLARAEELRAEARNRRYQEIAAVARTR